MTDHREWILALMIGPACAMQAQGTEQPPTHDVVIMREELSWTVTPNWITLPSQKYGTRRQPSTER